MLTGEYRNSVDEKGRLLLPSKLRAELNGSQLVLTRGVDACLWLFAPDEWEKIAAKVMGSASMFKSRTRLLQRRIIAPAQELEIDKAGRIHIPPTLRESAGLQKEAVILGIDRYIEIWDDAAYQKYLDESEADFQDAAEELGELLTM